MATARTTTTASPSVKKAYKKKPAKKTATKKTAEKKSAPEKEKMTILKGLNEKTTEQIASLLQGGEHLKAIQNYRLMTGATMKEATESIGKWWKDEQMKHIDTSKYPRKCCFNCLGACGRLKSLISEHGSKLWDQNTSAAAGLTCSQFMDEKIIEGWTKNVRVKLKKDGSRLIATINRDRKVIRVTIPSVTTDSRGNRNRAEEQTNYIVSDAKALTKLKELLPNMFEDGWGFHNKENNEEVFYIHGVEPKATESWDDYISRAGSALRELRVKTQEKYAEMSPSQLKVAIKKYFASKGAESILEDYEDVEQMVLDFFPGKTMNEVATMLHTLELG